MARNFIAVGKWEVLFRGSNLNHLDSEFHVYNPKLFSPLKYLN